jgi:glutathione peroxidase-family protein
MTNFHDLTMNDIEGRPVAFADFAAKYALIVNVASR